MEIIQNVWFSISDWPAWLISMPVIWVLPPILIAVLFMATRRGRP